MATVYKNIINPFTGKLQKVVDLAASGAATVASPDMAVQYNAGGSLSNDGSFLYDYNNQILLLGGLGIGNGHIRLAEPVNGFYGDIYLGTDDGYMTIDAQSVSLSLNPFSGLPVGIGYESQFPTGQLTIFKDNSNNPLVNSDSHFVLENVNGSQTLFTFSFGGTPIGGARGDSSGNFNWHASGNQGHQFYNSIDNSDARTHSIATNGFLVRDDSATGDTASYAFQAKDSGGTDMFHADVDGTGYFASTLTANSFVKSGGTSTQFLIANGSALPFYTGSATLVSGTKAVTITGVTSSNIGFISITTPGGTLASGYKVVCTTNTLTITSETTAGATNTLDTSTLNYLVI